MLITISSALEENDVLDDCFCYSAAMTDDSWRGERLGEGRGCGRGGEGEGRGREVAIGKQRVKMRRRKREKERGGTLFQFRIVHLSFTPLVGI